MRAIAPRFLAIALATTIVAPSFTVLTASTAFAQPKRKPLREQLNAEAQKHWDTALALYQRNQWDGARTSFNAAYEASKNPRVLFNVAVCEKNLGRYARAIEVFKRELEEGKGTLAPDEEAEIKTQISGLEQFVATLVIEVNEPGAEIFVDETKVGVSPLPGPVSVQLGERRIRATKAGFGEARETIELKGGSSGRVALKMASNTKTSLVSINVLGPQNATVKIDGKEVGPAPYKGQVVVSAEPHQFSAEAPGYVAATQSAVVREGEQLTLTLQLAMEQQKGKLLVSAKPEGAIIEIDGKVVGATKWEGPVDVGTHQISVKKQGFYTFNQDVEVVKGAERPITATLNEDRNTSFVPWLIGTVLVVGVSAVSIYFVTKPKDQDQVQGTLPPFTVGTPAVRF
ncbi:MAG: PEGA domain-containing protein [Deltaproteobacteria bacterium]|nr:PEGA domain-containing protein [Deltaproteobacteria bacterium]